MHRPPLTSMPVEYQTPAIEDRAIEVQLLLADLEHHRAPSVADLIVAATAELAGLTVVHLDKDFEMIAEVLPDPHYENILIWPLTGRWRSAVVHDCLGRPDRTPQEVRLAGRLVSLSA
jgi:DTW domain-containing protein YfiP